MLEADVTAMMPGFCTWSIPCLSRATSNYQVTRPDSHVSESELQHEDGFIAACLKMGLRVSLQVSSLVSPYKRLFLRLLGRIFREAQ